MPHKKASNIVSFPCPYFEHTKRIRFLWIVKHPNLGVSYNDLISAVALTFNDKAAGFVNRHSHRRSAFTVYV